MYRTICCELWTDDKVQALTPHEKLLFLYLITNPHSHLSGLYYLPTILIRHEVQLGRGFDGAWKGLLTSPMVAYESARSLVWVVNMMLYQGRGQKTEKGVASHLATLHASPLLERFLLRYPQIIPYLSSDFIRCPIDTPSEGHRAFPSPVPDSSLNPLHLKSKVRSISTPLPTDFKPDERAVRIAQGFQQNAFALAAEFRDYHMAKGTVFRDWQAAFRTWMNNDRKFKERRR